MLGNCLRENHVDKLNFRDLIFEFALKQENFLSEITSQQRMRLSICIFLTLVSLSASAQQTWKIRASIAAVNPEKNSITIDHGVIKGLAEEAGQVEVRVSSGDHARAEGGRVIRGTLSADPDGLRLHTIWPAESGLEQTMTLINRDLTRPKLSRVAKKPLSQGDELPRFALYNQRGKLVTADNLKDKVVVLNFIFTRSRVPSMCPATTKRMAELQRLLIDNGYKNSVRQVSLSLDPEYDTPGVCYDYLDILGVDHDTFWLLTGSAKALKQLTKDIGVVSSPSEKSIINHSMVTLIIDQEGKVFYRKPGSRWDVEDVYNRLEILLKPWQ